MSAAATSPHAHAHHHPHSQSPPSSSSAAAGEDDAATAAAAAIDDSGEECGNGNAGADATAAATTTTATTTTTTPRGEGVGPGGVEVDDHDHDAMMKQDVASVVCSPSSVLSSPGGGVAAAGVDTPTEASVAASAPPQQPQSSSSSPPPPPSLSSISLAVHGEDASRMMEASAALNECLRRVKARRGEGGEGGDGSAEGEGESRRRSGTPTKRKLDDVDGEGESGGGGGGGTVSPREDGGDDPERVVGGSADADAEQARKSVKKRTSDLMQAASECDHPLISSFLAQLGRKNAPVLSPEEVETCLVLFLDSDKSAKLLAAFGVLQPIGRRGRGGGGGAGAGDVGKKGGGQVNVKKEEEEHNVTVKDEAGSDGNDSDAVMADGGNDADANAGDGSVGVKTECGSPGGGGDNPPSDVTENKLTRGGMTALFRCFLAAISMCITNNQQQQPSPGGGAAAGRQDEGEDRSSRSRRQCCTDLSDKSWREIRDVAAHATDRLVEHFPPSSLRPKGATAAAGGAADQEGLGTASPPPKHDNKDEGEKGDPSPSSPPAGEGRRDEGAVVISFEDFGEWYNAGGFELVPWLELLDLGKWDYAGRRGGGGGGAGGGLRAPSSGSVDPSTPVAGAAAAAGAAEPSSSPSPSSLAGGRSSSEGHRHPPVGGMPHSQQQQGQQQQQQQPQGGQQHPILSVITEESPSPEPHPGPQQRGAAAAGRHPHHNNHPHHQGHHAQQQHDHRVPLPPPAQAMPPPTPPPPPGRCVVSFDFTGAMPGDRPLHVNITEENLGLLRSVVTGTGLMRRGPQDVCDVVLRHSVQAPVHHHHPQAMMHHHQQQHSQQQHLVLTKEGFGQCMRELVPPAVHETLDEYELVTFSNFLCGLFSCFDREGTNVVDAKELAAGFTFLCGGNKSSKLAVAFRLVDENHEGFLTGRGLSRFLRSYLTVIVGISTSTPNSAVSGGGSSSSSQQQQSKLSRQDMFHAVDNGANWTQSHIFNCPKAGVAAGNGGRVTFEDFAGWYTEGGYTVAPWLELLDLSKFISLLDGGGDGAAAQNPSDTNSSAVEGDKAPSSSQQQQQQQHSRANHHPGGGSSDTASKEVLFSFPLANEHNLVILKEDVYYVRSVVDQLGLPQVSPTDLWTHHLGKHAPPPPHHGAPPAIGGGAVDQDTFVRAMESAIFHLTGRKVDGGVRFTLSNFFSSYDLDQVHRVQLTQLMGGITLLCHGRKSAKLAFSFGLFDGRTAGVAGGGMPPPHSHDPTKQGEAGAALNGDELFLFLRSFLIVLFSCCAQSLELAADVVSLWINDTAKMVCENVMRYQWNSGKRSVNFDDFGVWYNQGGFEIAPWLELLDLNKWVLDSSAQPQGNSMPEAACTAANSSDTDIQPMMDAPMPGDFGYDDFAGLDHIMMHPDEKENDVNPSNLTPTAAAGAGRNTDDSSLTFQLLTNEEHGGYLVAISQERVALLRQLVTESGFYRMEASQVCGRLLEYSDKDSGLLSKDQYDNAIRGILSGVGTSMSSENQHRLSEILNSIFYSFDNDNSQRVNAIEFVSGFTVLCGGRKSDKLEYSFELIDDDRDGKLSRQGLCKYLRSFLTVLLSISSAKSAMNEERINSAIDSGANWVTSQVFGNEDINGSRLITFDDFAAWYTKGGYGVIPWLELLDLKKWVIVP